MPTLRPRKPAPDSTPGMSDQAASVPQRHAEETRSPSNQESNAVTESDRLVFEDISLAENVRQVIVTTDNPITARKIHIKSETQHLLGKFSDETAQVLAKIVFAPSTEKRTEVQAGASEPLNTEDGSRTQLKEDLDTTTADATE